MSGADLGLSEGGAKPSSESLKSGVYNLLLNSKSYTLYNSTTYHGEL